MHCPTNAKPKSFAIFVCGYKNFGENEKNVGVHGSVLLSCQLSPGMSASSVEI